MYEGFESIDVRVGYTHNKHVYDGTQIDFNILAPGIVTNHLALGGTYHIDENRYVDGVVLYAFKDSVCGTSNFGLGTVTHQMYQFSFGFNVGMTF